MIVCKFGGTSVGDADAIRRASGIIRGRLHRRPVVVVSALSGTTDALVSIADEAGRGEIDAAMQTVDRIRVRHLDVCATLLGQHADAVRRELEGHFDHLGKLAQALAVLGHSTPRASDTIMAMGEACSARIVSAAFRLAGIDAVHVDSRTVVRTDDNFMSAEPVPEAIEVAAASQVLPHVRAGRVPVLEGFVGATGSGITTTLGRGGSDYTAALIGAALQAESIEIWTDVDGILTSDPRVVPNARLISEVGFNEAAELASFGAKVLHPSTIAPAVRVAIPVWILNSRRPEGKGTRITYDAPPRLCTALAARTGVTIVRIDSLRMLLAHGVLQKIFEVFARYRTSVDVVATSEVSVSVTVDDTPALAAIQRDLETLGESEAWEVRVERNRGMLALVGSILGSSTPVIARAIAALGDLRVHMVSLSATGINLTLLIDGDAVPDAMRRLHAEFFNGDA